jgi:hypothetical protein
MSCLCYFPILYVRSPVAYLDDSIFSRPLLRTWVLTARDSF